ncbi:MAG TPA: hypothetical protein VJ919_05205 [Tangfeifania sp.]|nr:hypothetical protein [Tangfeifania sp.]
MEVIKIILLAVALVSIALLGLATQILLKKGGKFPNTHVGGNKHLKRQGVHCYQTQDKIEQKNARKEVDFKNVKILKVTKAG